MRERKTREKMNPFVLGLIIGVVSTTIVLGIYLWPCFIAMIQQAP